MSDLISRSELLKAFAEKTPFGCGTVGIKFVDDLIKAQPTAHDANKVALELRHLAFRLPKDYSGLDGKDRAVMFDDAIDIVRKGGIE